MNHTAICGHAVPAVGAPGSAARARCESEPCAQCAAGYERDMQAKERLERAAPALLAALERLLAFDEMGEASCLCNEKEYVEDGDICPYCEARAAIAKAKGGA